MRVTAVHDLCAERANFMETIESLTGDEFDNAPTLCSEWAPRDVLAHLIANDRMPANLRLSTLTLHAFNARGVAWGRSLTRGELMHRGYAAAERPTRFGRALSYLLVGDAAMHHQDVLRGLGRSRPIPEHIAAAIFREGIIWSWLFGAKLLRYRVIPTTPGGWPIGRGVPVRGTTEALALWLAGRAVPQDELTVG